MLFSLMMSTVSEEGAAEDEKSRTRLKCISNYSVNKLYRRDHDGVS